MTSPLSEPKYIYKRDSGLMSLIASLPFIPKTFMERFWTTIGQTIYVPDSVDMSDPGWKVKHRVTIAHENVHRIQFLKYGYVLMFLIYVLFPLPVYFSGRYFIERPAYLVSLSFYPKHMHDAVIEKIVETLWENYFFAWPKSWMRKWFKEKAKRL